VNYARHFLAVALTCAAVIFELLMDACDELADRVIPSEGGPEKGR